MKKYIKPISRIIKLNQMQLLDTSVTYSGEYKSGVTIGAKHSVYSSELEEENYEEDSNK